MANETMRIFFPLKIVTYPQGESGMEDNPVQMTSSEGAAYEDAILAAISKGNRQFENDRVITITLMRTDLYDAPVKRISCMRP